MVSVTITNAGKMFERTDARLLYLGLSGHKRIDIKQDKEQGDANTSVALGRTIAQLGLDGWEMVASQGEGLLYFKRALAG